MNSIAVNCTYDALELISTVTANGGHVVTLGYNDYDQITSVQVGSAGNERFWALRDFDEYGRLTNSIDRNGVTTTNNYDYLDRMLTRRVIGATGDQMSGLETFEYTARGLTNYTDARGQASRASCGMPSRGPPTKPTRTRRCSGSRTIPPITSDGKSQMTSWNYDGAERVTNIQLKTKPK